MTQQLDRLVEAYLAEVARACADLSPQARDGLLADLREHIASARADLTQEDEEAVQTILDRLGDPRSIAAEARHDAPAPAPTPPPAPPRAKTPVWVIVGLALVGMVVLLCVGVIALGGLFVVAPVQDEPPTPVSSYVPAPSGSPG